MGFSDIFKNLKDETLEYRNMTSLDKDIDDIESKMFYDPTTDNDQAYENYLKSWQEKKKLIDERNKSALIAETARKNLENSGHDNLASMGTFGQSINDLGAALSSDYLAAKAAVATKGLSIPASILYNTYRGGHGASIESKNEAKEMGATPEQAEVAYWKSLPWNMLAESPGEAARFIPIKAIMGAIPGASTVNVLSKIANGKATKEIMKRAGQILNNPAGKFATTIAEKTKNPLLGRIAVGTAGAVGNAALEIPTEHAENIISHTSTNSALGQDVSLGQVIKDYWGSPEMQQTTKDTFWGSLPVSVLTGGAIGYGAQLGKGYNSASATRNAKSIQENMERLGILNSLNKENVSELKEMASEILKLYGEDKKASDLSDEDALRINMQFREDTALIKGADQKTAERDALADTLSFVMDDEETNFENQVSQKVYDFMKSNYDYDMNGITAVDKTQFKETLNEQANNLEQNSANVNTNNKQQNVQGQSTNSDNTTLKTPHPEFAQGATSQGNNGGYISNRKATGNAEPNMGVRTNTNTNTVNGTVESDWRSKIEFPEVPEDFQGEGNVLLDVVGVNVRVRQIQTGGFGVSVVEENGKESPARVFDTIEQVNEVLKDIKQNVDEIKQ